MTDTPKNPHLNESDILQFQHATPLDLTQEEVQDALARLSHAVKDEPVPEVWNTIGSEPRDVVSFEQMSSGDATSTTLGDGMRCEENIDRVSGAQSSRKRSNVRWYRKRVGRLASGLVAAGVVAVLLVTPLGGRVMAGAMQTLYMNKLVGVGQSDFNQIQNALDNSRVGGSKNIDLKKYGSVHTDNAGQSETNITVAKARQLSGLPIKAVPGFNTKHGNVFYSPTTNVTFRLHVKAINQLIHRLGGKASFPASIDGKPIVFHIPARVSENMRNQNGTFASLSMLKLPTIQVPSGTDLNQVRQALMDLPFLPSDIRNELKSSQNWKHTMFVPVGGQVKNISINGYPAVYSVNQQAPFQAVQWLEKGVLYAYQWNGSSKSPGISRAQFMAQVKEIAQ